MFALYFEFWGTEFSVKLEYTKDWTLYHNSLTKSYFISQIIIDLLENYKKQCIEKKGNL